MKQSYFIIIIIITFYFNTILAMYLRYEFK